MECPNVHIILPQVVALLFYSNEYSLTANKHYKWIPTISMTFSTDCYAQNFFSICLSSPWIVSSSSLTHIGKPMFSPFVNIPWWTHSSLYTLHILLWISQSLASSWQKQEVKDSPHKLFTHADYADDIALQANSPIQAESLLCSLEWAADGIGLHVNAVKTEYMCFNQRGKISTLKSGPLKLADKFTNFERSVSSTENDINAHLTSKGMDSNQ